MAQVTIYLPDDLEDKARKTASAEGKSVSRWIADQLVQSLQDSWPEAVQRAAGACADFPDLSELRGGYGADAPRERIE